MNPANYEDERERLDELLVRRGLFGSRSRARDAIERGTVSVDGQAATRPGKVVSVAADIAVHDPARAYVSRAALKLICGLDHFEMDPTASHALDIGASTGGFTQVLLERGAAHVHAIDVGHGQMDAELRADGRVTCIERLNARDLTLEHLGGVRPDFVVSDVSFISIVQALPPALTIAAPGARAIVLVKPQFEAGREAIGKGGLLKDSSDAQRIAQERSHWLDGFAGWRSLGFIPSPIAGGDGNAEFLLGGIKGR